MNIVSENDLKIQAQKAIDNLKIAIESAGGNLQNIVVLRFYLVDYKPKNGEIISGILINNFVNSIPPAST